jgi:hypothetical protein
METREEFFARMLPYARKVSERTGIDPRVIIAQAALETGYGKSAPNNNYFGIKSTGQGGQTLPTTEYVNGKPVQMDQSFRTYGDMGQSAEDYGSFMLKNPRYADVLSATGLDEQIAALGKSGYATDPNYAAKLKNIAGKINLNAPQNIASDTMTALGRGTDRAKLPQNSGTMMSGLLDASTNRQEKKMGLLDQLGIQKRDPNAQGDAARPFYQRDQFKNAMGDLALAFNTLRMNPDQNLAASVAAGQEKRVSAQNKNKTVAWLKSQGRDDLANAVESGSITGSDAANVLFTAPKDDRTALQKNYEYARSQGMPDAEARAWATSAPVTNIQMGDKAGTAFEVEAAKGQATMFNEMMKQGVDANADLGQIDVIDQLLGQVNGGTADAWRSWAQQSLNVDLGTGGSVEALNAAVNRLVPAQRTPGSGTMSDRDVALFKSSLPQLINSPEGNKIITETMRAMALYKRAQGQIAGEVMAQTKTRAQAIKELQALPDPFEKVKQIVGKTGGGQSTGNMPSREDAANLLLGNGG